MSPPHRHLTVYLYIVSCTSTERPYESVHTVRIYLRTYVHTALTHIRYLHTYAPNTYILYIHAYIHTYTNMHFIELIHKMIPSQTAPFSTHVHTYLHVRTYTHMHTYVHNYMYIHTHTHAYIRTYVYMHTHTHAYIRTYMYIHTHTHAYIHVHTTSIYPLWCVQCRILIHWRGELESIPTSWLRPTGISTMPTAFNAIKHFLMNL